jgi:hypothetical protein
MNEKIGITIIALFVAWASMSGPANASEESIKANRIKAKSGTHYLLIFQRDTRARWTTIRPKKEDKSIVLCIPAAFTLSYGGVDGFYACDGQLFNKDNPDKSIGGTVVVLNGKCNVVSSPAGKIDDNLIAAVKAQKGDLFQQFQVVADGKGEKFKDPTRFQRRGIAIFGDDSTAIIESNEAITLTQFGEDAASMGVQQLAYTDMGPWDEGWVRNPANGKLVKIGQNRSLTDRQSNWLYFRISESQSLNLGEPKETRR